MNFCPVKQDGFANRHTSQSRKPLGSVKYLDGLQAQGSALRAAQAETERELSALTLSPSVASGMPSVLDRAFKGEL